MRKIKKHTHQTKSINTVNHFGCFLHVLSHLSKLTTSWVIEKDWASQHELFLCYHCDIAFYLLHGTYPVYADMFQINVCKHSIYLHLGLVNCNLSRKLVEVLEIHAIIMEYNQPNPHYTLCNLSLERIVILWFSLVLFVCLFFSCLTTKFFLLSICKYSYTFRTRWKMDRNLHLPRSPSLFVTCGLRIFHF